MKPMRSILARFAAPLCACAIVLAAVVSASSAIAHDPELVQVQAKGSFDETATGIREGLEAHKLMVPRQYHFHDMLRMAGIESEHMMTFETFHPRFGKVVYANDRSAFVELPLRIHLRETDNGVVIWYRRPSSIFGPYDGLAELGAELDTLFADVIAQVSDE